MAGAAASSASRSANLSARESHAVAAAFAEPGPGTVARQPFLGQQPLTAVAQRDRRFPSRQRCDDDADGRGDFAEFDDAFKIEPVDAGTHLRAGGGRGAMLAAFRFDRPALRNEPPNRIGQPAGAKLPHRARRGARELHGTKSASPSCRSASRSVSRSRSISVRGGLVTNTAPCRVPRSLPRRAARCLVLPLVRLPHPRCLVLPLVRLPHRRRHIRT